MRLYEFFDGACGATLCDDRTYQTGKPQRDSYTCPLQGFSFEQQKVRNNLGPEHQRNEGVFGFAPIVNIGCHRDALSRYNSSLGVRDKRLLLLLCCLIHHLVRSKLKDNPAHNPRHYIYNL
jgi:hypothetical protein